MHHPLRIGLVLVLTSFLSVSCTSSGGGGGGGGGPKSGKRHHLPAIPATSGAKMDADEPPPAPREFRAVWVATVGNIDWPSKPGLSTQQQKDEALRILDRAEEINLNAIVLQVRTTADALYESKLEPWSYFLTGKQGQPPSPYYDPLQFWIEESHKRGLELHAWFNPYRTKYAGGKYEAADSHVSKRRPDLDKEYGRSGWMDPGEPDAQEHSFNVFMDVVERYDVDGIHIDDYFYPYQERLNPKDPDDTRMLPFPDDASYKKYTDRGGKLKRDDWRRDNINQLIERIYKGIRARKKHVQFGISPFGVPRAGIEGLEYTKGGFDQYEKLYADAVLWLRNGWCDYFAPQLYWPIYRQDVPYFGLLRWWTEHNPKRRHIYPGLFTSKIDWSDTTYSAETIMSQIMLTRLVDGAGGHIHFSAVALNQDRDDLASQLRDGLYAKEAIVPATTWLDNDPPATPTGVKADRVPGVGKAPAKKEPATTQAESGRRRRWWTTGPATRRATARQRGGTTRPFYSLTTQPAEEKWLPQVRVTWQPGKGDENVFQWAVYYKIGDAWNLKLVPGHERETVIRDSRASGPVQRVAVSAVDRSGNESKRKTIDTGLRPPAKKDKPSTQPTTATAAAVVQPSP